MNVMGAAPTFDAGDAGEFYAVWRITPFTIAGPIGLGGGGSRVSPHAEAAVVDARPGAGPLRGLLRHTVERKIASLFRRVKMETKNFSARSSGRPADHAQITLPYVPSPRPRGTRVALQG